MSSRSRVPSNQYVAAEYLQFNGAVAMRRAMAVLGMLTWPLVLPLAMLSRVSDLIFRTCSETLALVPYFPGVIIRYEFYRFALTHCGRNIVIEGGAVFIYRDVSIGDNVLIGRQCIVHHCDIGDDVLIGERCTFLSGSRQHSFDRLDVPMTQQGGHKRRIVLHGDNWIGTQSVIMADVGRGAIVAAGAVVTDQVAPHAIVGGVPARQISSRLGQRSTDVA